MGSLQGRVAAITGGTAGIGRAIAAPKKPNGFSGKSKQGIAAFSSVATRWCRWGRVINISSVEGKNGKPVFTAYTAAKHAVNGLTKSVAQEVGTLGVTVNSICPGLIITDIVRDSGPATAEAMGLSFDEMVDLFSQDSAIKRPNKVEEVAALAVLLASENGAGITGAILSVDGGTSHY